jgi:branched-chain amino acid transport system substrate-binding protein
VKLEVVPFDNKVSPQESLNQLKRVIDQDIRYITQGNGSSVAGALIEAVNRHNERNPGKEILFLNYAAVDPDFTNSKCSFWHFRFDANTHESRWPVQATRNYLDNFRDCAARFY